MNICRICNSTQDKRVTIINKNATIYGYLTCVGRRKQITERSRFSMILWTCKPTNQLTKGYTEKVIW